MFATILQRLKQQDELKREMHEENKKALSEIRDEVKKTNGRVTVLERWRTYHKGYTAGIALVVSIFGSAGAWLLWHFFGK